MKTGKESGACFLRRVSGILYLCSKHKTLGYKGILIKPPSLPLTPKPDPTPRSVCTHLCMCTRCLCLSSSSTGLVLGKEDEIGKQWHGYVAITPKMAHTEVGESNNGRRHCLTAPFSLNQEHGMGRSDM